MAQVALGGVRVLEYCEMVCGPYCTKLLADLGAEVVKVERPGTGDRARSRGPFLNDTPHPERSGLFLYLNTNKLGVTVDPATDAGRAAFLERVGRADVLVEDTAPGTMTGLGLGCESLWEVNPRLIVTSVTGFGQTGPYRDYKGHHLNIYHASGQAQFSYTEKRGRDTPPVKGGGMVGDYDAGLSAAVATLAALYRRGTDGAGQHIDVSRQEALISLDRVDISNFANDPNAGARRRGMLGGLMPCKDGHVVVVAPQQHQWEALVQLLGDPEWAHDEKCRDEWSRAENATELQPRIEEWMRQHTKQEIYHRGQSYGCPVAPVNSSADVYNSAQQKYRRFFVEIDHPEAGTFDYPSAPYRLSETPWRVQRPAPLLGEHDASILRHAGQGKGALGQVEYAGDHARGEGSNGGAPLAGVRVVDFTWAWAGPYAALLLALLGAEVIKVESRRRLDHTRLRSLMTGPTMGGPDHSAVFNDINLNKLSITLNLGRPEAVGIARELVKVSDVVIQNMRPGVMDRLGLGYEALKETRPDIIMLSSSAVGTTGPEQGYVGYAPNFAALSGLAYITGHPDGPPSTLTGAIDTRVGTTAAFAILAALYYRRRTGRGQHIDLSSSEAIGCLAGDVFMDYTMNGRVRERSGNRDEVMAPHGCYPCQGEDRWVTIAVATEEEWRAFCKAVERPEWGSDARFADAASRRRHEAELDSLISEWTRWHTDYDVMRILQDVGVASAPTFSGRSIPQDPHCRERGIFVEVEHPVLGRRVVVGPPWRLSGTPACTPRAAPLLGEHNRYVLDELLGISQEEIERLVRDEVVY